jgi:hypothetical protein
MHTLQISSEDLDKLLNIKVAELLNEEKKSIALLRVIGEQVAEIKALREEIANRDNGIEPEEEGETNA